MVRNANSRHHENADVSPQANEARPGGNRVAVNALPRFAQTWRKPLPPRIIGVVIGLTLWSGCATTPAPMPINEQSSIIGISVKIRTLKLFSKSAMAVYFVRIDDGDPFSQESLIRSNYVDGDYAYLINAKPGRYAAVAAMNQGNASSSSSPTPVGGGVSVSAGMGATVTMTTYFPSELIETTDVTVGPSSVAFMGRFTVDRAGLRQMNEADETQQHYYRTLTQPGGVESGLLSRHYSGSGTKLDQSEGAWKSFLDHARKRLAENGWESALQSPVASGPPGS